MDEFQQPVGLGIFRTVLGYAGEYGLGMIAEHCEFHQIGRVEHYVRIFLIRVYPFIFGGTHLRPLTDGLAGSERAVVVVADDASQQTVVTRRDAVVIVKGDAREGGYEDAELDPLGDA